MHFRNCKLVTAANVHHQEKETKHKYKSKRRGAVQKHFLDYEKITSAISHTSTVSRLSWKETEHGKILRSSGKSSQTLQKAAVKYSQTLVIKNTFNRNRKMTVEWRESDATSELYLGPTCTMEYATKD